MITLPSNWSNILTRPRLSFNVVYELELAAATLYYGPSKITWDGNTYTALAIKQSAIIDDMGTRLPEMSVEFSNVNTTLRSQIEPTDLLTGRRMIVRLIVKDGADYSSDSVVLFLGLMERPRKIDEDRFRIKVVRIGRGQFSQTPIRPITKLCTVAQFADGVECNYSTGIGTTQAVGNYSGSGGTTNITVGDSESIMWELDHLQSGATTLLNVGSNTEVECSNATDTPTYKITIDADISGSNGDVIAFAKCGRHWAACQSREEEESFQGFRGEQYSPWRNDWMVGRAIPVGTPNPNPTRQRPTHETWLTDRIVFSGFEAVPLVVGRRLIPGIMHEERLIQWPGATIRWKADSYILCEGEIEELVDWYANSEIQADINITLGGNAYRHLGVYYRAGEQGTIGTETTSDYGSSDVKLRPQNSDVVVSNAGNVLSRTAWTTFIMPTDANEGFEEASEFDVKGVKIQKYAASNPPSESGSPQWLANPIWQAIHVNIADRFGAGRIVQPADYDFATTVPEADLCDATRSSGFTAIVSDFEDQTRQAYASPHVYHKYLYTVDDVQDFEAGMAVVYNGTNYTNDPDEIVAVFPQSQRLWLTVDRSTGWQVGDTITTDGYLKIYENHDRYTQVSPTDGLVNTILRSCRGYTTYDEEGRIQHRLERAITATGMHFQDDEPDTGYGIKADSFKWILERDGQDRRKNMVIATYVDHVNTAVPVFAADFDNIAVHGVRSLALDLRGVNNRWQAQRLADLELAKIREIGTGAEFIVGPIGLALQPGDRIHVTHALPDWTNESKRVVRKEIIGLGDDDELMVKLLVEDYVADIYDDVAPIPQETLPDGDIPGLDLTVNLASLGRVALTWAFDDTPTFATLKYYVYKSTSSFGQAWHVDPSKIIATIPTNGLSPGGTYTYQALDEEMDTTLYFKVAAVIDSRETLIVSNEVSVAPGILDPTDTQFTPGRQTVFDPGFEGPDYVWNAAPASPSGTYLPDDHYMPTNLPFEFASPDGTYSNQTYAYDGDENTSASATPSTEETYAVAVRFSSGGTGEGGDLYRKAGSTGSPVKRRQGSLQYWFFSTDGGSSWSYGGDADDNPATWAFESLSNVTRTDLELAVAVARRNPTSPAITGWLNEVEWRVQGPDGFSDIVTSFNGYGVVRGDASSAYGELWRPWPGETQETIELAENEEYVTQIRAKIEETGSGHPLLVQLRHVDSDTYYTLIGNQTSGIAEDANYLSSSWRAFAGKWTVPAGGLIGTFEVYVRTLNDARIDVDCIMIEQGSHVHKWIWFDQRQPYRGEIQGFTTGPWTTDLVRVSEITI